MDQAITQAIEDYFSHFPLRRYQKGQMLLHAHDDPKHIFYLIEGRVKQYDISYQGDEVVLNTFKPPAFFPMSYAINRTPNPYFFEADSDVELHLVPLDDAVSFVKNHPTVLYDLLARVYRGIDGLLGRLAHLMAGTARSRLLYELLIEARRFGAKRGPGVVISLNETDLASRAGLSRETVSREIQRLKAENLVSVIKNEIFIDDLSRLAGVVGQEL